MVSDRKVNRKRDPIPIICWTRDRQDLQKIGEEAAEVIIGAKNNNPDEIRYEIADLIYHLIVLMVDRGLTWEDICQELQKEDNFSR